MDVTTNVLVVDINNEQREYAQVIYLLNNCFGRMLPVKRYIPHISALDLKKTFKILRGANTSSTAKLAEQAERAEELVNISSYGELKKEIERLFLRVDFKGSSNSLVELQYLGLVLHYAQTLNIPFYVCFHIESDREYFRISHYLQHYTLESAFDLCCHDSKKGYRKLAARGFATQRTFQPLICIDAEELSRFNEVRRIFFSRANEAKDIPNALFCDKTDSWLSNVCRMLANSINDVLDFKYRSSPERKNVFNVFCEHLSNWINDKQLSRLELALFVAILNLSPEYIEMVNGGRDSELTGIKAVVNTAYELRTAVYQILENAVNHSEFKECVFTYRLHKEGITQDMEEKYGVSGNNQYVEIMISDLNFSSSVISNFQQTVIKEREHGFAINNGFIPTKIRYLFDLPAQATNDPEYKAWVEYREATQGYHTGLQKARKAVEHANGLLYMRSSTSYNFGDEFYFYNATRSDAEMRHESKLACLPGTQYAFVFPCGQSFSTSIQSETSRPEGLLHNTFSDTFENLAQYLKRPTPIIDLDLSFLPSKITAQDQKDNLWVRVKETLNREMVSINNNAIYCITIPDNKVHSEVVLKGLEQSFFAMQGVKNLAILNCDDAFVRAVLNLYNNICSFSEERQLFFATQEDEYFFVGKDINAMKRSHQQIAYIRGLSPLKDIKSDEQSTQSVTDALIPFDSLLLTDDNVSGRKMTYFDRFVSKLAGRDLFESDAGYRIKDIHMRLREVHVDTFYELAVLCRKSYVAKRFAFEIILYAERQGLNFESGSWLFYGYASYSQAILNALTEILRYRFGENNPAESRFHFAAYLNDLRLYATNKNIPIHFSNETWKDAKIKKEIPNNISIITLVPIGTTLRTFERIEQALEEELSIRLDDHICFRASMFRTTVSGDKHAGEKSIVTFIQLPAKGEDPLTCEWCFPSDDFLKERPAIDTDPTSTVPNHQFYGYSDAEQYVSSSNEASDASNGNNVELLDGNIAYGHFERSKNHYQFYVDTLPIVHKHTIEICEWLRGLRPENDKNTPVIIVTPQHLTNREFAEYVNNNRYGGLATIISFDGEKQFRTNFEAEYSEYRKFAETWDGDIQIVYADDSIISGQTFHRLNNLMRSLMYRTKSEALRQKMWSPSVFSDIFTLINRLSPSTLREYIDDPEKHFHSFIRLNISHVRNFGDSCPVCKLRNFSKRLIESSSTRLLHQYWVDKYDDLKPVPFDDNKRFDRMTGKKYASYFKTHIAHKLNTKIRPFMNTQSDNEFEVKFYESIKIVAEETKGLSDVDWHIHLVEMISRPFFTYNNRYSQYLLKLLVVLCEDYFVHKGIKEKPHYNTDIHKGLRELSDSLRVQNCLKEQKYFRKIIKALCTIRSNYLIRAETIQAVCALYGNTEIAVCEEKGKERPEKCDAQKVFETYVASVQTLIYSGTGGIENFDVARSFRLEHALIYGREYPECTRGIVSDNNLRNTLLLENIAVVFEGIKKDVKPGDFLKLELGNQESDEEATTLWEILTEFSAFLRGESNTIQQNNSKSALTALTNVLKQIMVKKQHARDKEMQATPQRIQKFRDHIAKIAERFVRVSGKVSVLCRNIETDAPSNQRVIDITESEYVQSIEIINFILTRNNDTKDYVVTDNSIYLILQTNPSANDIDMDQSNDSSAIYVRIPTNENDPLKILMAIKYILMFRHMTVEWLSKTDALKEQMRTVKVLSSLGNSKAGDHTNYEDLYAFMKWLETRRFTDRELYGSAEACYHSFLSLLTYTNQRIARLYRRKEEMEAKFGSGIIPEEKFKTLYVKSDHTLAADPSRYLENIGCDIVDNVSENPANGRLAYFDLFFKLLSISVDGVSVSTSEELSDMLHSYDTVTVDDSNGIKWAYKGEYIIAAILDFLFSTLKLSPLPNDGSNINTLRARYENCFSATTKIAARIRRESRYLVLENDLLCKKMNKDGMSLEAIAWYVNTLYNPHNGTNPRSVKPSIGKNFVLKLPILRENNN